MTHFNFSSFINLILSASDKQSTPADRTAFYRSWLRYQAAFPGQGDKPLFDAALALGFEKPGKDSTCSYCHLIAAYRFLLAQRKPGGGKARSMKRHRPPASAANSRVNHGMSEEQL